MNKQHAPEVSTGFCSECHEAAYDRVVAGHAREEDTNAGGYYWASDCCEADLYTRRTWEGGKWVYKSIDLVDDYVEPDEPIID